MEQVFEKKLMEAAQAVEQQVLDIFFQNNKDENFNRLMLN